MGILPYAPCFFVILLLLLLLLLDTEDDDDEEDDDDDILILMGGVYCCVGMMLLMMMMGVVDEIREYINPERETKTKNDERVGVEGKLLFVKYIDTHTHIITETKTHTAPPRPPEQQQQQHHPTAPPSPHARRGIIPLPTGDATL